MVRNSSVDVKLVVFTEEWPAMFEMVVFGSDLMVLAFAFICEAVDDVVTVVGCRDGAAPVACCRSLPCSVMRAGPRLERWVRSWGVILVRTMSLTGCLEDASE